ncbi:stromal cell-derived factor 2 [Condylostylus longicornis]|uniref:stromal cell-derived factor 2 n=1 Tax=Condylostylus longicornis TaxID=2530218 RepID=UPI00244DABF8|nr:stromal cell-derived factor 2 [Condylostylus longicornis]
MKMEIKSTLGNIFLYFMLFLLALVYRVEGNKSRYVTCGSLIKLMNYDYSYRLHSHDVKYGSGSGQQSVTAVDLKEDVNSHWYVKSKIKKTCERGEPIKCGDIIRLEHLTTKKNLHSHYFSSPLAGEQEVSCYGDDGEGDTGDHWEVICSGDNWERVTPIQLRHTDTGAYLGITGRTFGRPISGQMEVAGFSGPTRGTRWVTQEGLYIMPKETKDEIRHDEF